MDGIGYVTCNLRLIILHRGTSPSVHLRTWQDPAFWLHILVGPRLSEGKTGNPGGTRQGLGLHREWQQALVWCQQVGVQIRSALWYRGEERASTIPERAPAPQFGRHGSLHLARARPLPLLLYG